MKDETSKLSNGAQVWRPWKRRGLLCIIIFHLIFFIILSVFISSLLFFPLTFNLVSFIFLFKKILTCCAPCAFLDISVRYFSILFSLGRHLLSVYFLFPCFCNLSHCHTCAWFVNLTLCLSVFCLIIVDEVPARTRYLSRSKTSVAFSPWSSMILFNLIFFNRLLLLLDQHRLINQIKTKW